MVEACTNFVASQGLPPCARATSGRPCSVRPPPQPSPQAGESRRLILRRTARSHCRVIELLTQHFATKTTDGASLTVILNRRPKIDLVPLVGWLLLVFSQPSHAQTATTSTPDPSIAVLADSFARLIRDAIPPQYDKQEDWGATREITVGYRIDGKPFHYHAHPRKKAVNHGTWKHYKLQLVEPDKNLAVQFVKLQPLEGGRFAFTLRLNAKIDAWTRAKVYERGVHLIAVETEGDMRVQLEVDGEVGVRLLPVAGSPTVAIEPVVTDARLTLEEFAIRRVSNANGPLVRQLGDGVRRLVENEMDGPQLTAKLNRAIEKKRDRLVFKPSELFGNSWSSMVQATSKTPIEAQK